jgi:hypothetical protein
MSELPPELRSLVARLREPVAASPGFTERVLAAMRGARVPSRNGRHWWAAAGAVAALLAAAALLPLVQQPAPERARPVPFLLVAPHAARVAIVGDFNDWDPAATPLHPAGGEAWWVVVPLRPGRYRYSFVVDGVRWLADPAAPRAVDDDFGPESSVLTVLRERT